MAFQEMHNADNARVQSTIYTRNNQKIMKDGETNDRGEDGLAVPDRNQHVCQKNCRAHDGKRGPCRLLCKGLAIPTKSCRIATTQRHITSKGAVMTDDANWSEKTKARTYCVYVFRSVVCIQQGIMKVLRGGKRGTKVETRKWKELHCWSDNDVSNTHILMSPGGGGGDYKRS